MGGDILRGFAATVVGFIAGIAYDAVTRGLVGILQDFNPKLVDLVYLVLFVGSVEALVDDVTSLIVSSISYIAGTALGYALVGDIFGLLLAVVVLLLGILLRLAWGFEPTYDM